MAKITPWSQQDQLLVRMQCNWNFYQQGRMQNDITLKSSLVLCYKVKKITFNSQPSNHNPIYLCGIKVYSHKLLCDCLTNLVFLNWTMDKQTLVYPYNGILVLIQTTTWANLKCIMLRERSQTKKTIHWIPGKASP
jgi:hypothetical protein